MTKSPEVNKGKCAEKEAVKAAVHSSKHDRAAPSVAFKVNDLHTKALLALFRCHHNDQELTYSELSSEIGIGEKTKRWQCEAWKDLKGHGYIVQADNVKKTFKLSDKGMEFSTTFVSDKELAELKAPLTNEEHHEKIRARLLRFPKGTKTGPEIFDVLLKHQDTPMTRLELVTKTPGKSSNPDSHGFYYGFKNLMAMGLVEEIGKVTVADMRSMKTEMYKGKSENEKVRIRGGRKKFKLSGKAFLATVPREDSVSSKDETKTSTDPKQEFADSALGAAKSEE